MKNKHRQSIKNTTKLKTTVVLKYAIGITLGITFIFTIIFLANNIFNSSDSYAGAHGAETSIDNSFGVWEDNSTWVDGWTDGSPTSFSLPETNADITIFGHVEIGSLPSPPPGSGDLLTFSSNKDSYNFVVNDTLIVFGDVDFANKAMGLNLQGDAVFIVIGNVEMNNKIDISSSGILVVSGNFNKSGSRGSYAGDGNVYAGSYSGDAESTIDSDDDSSFTIDQLSDDGFQEIEDFINGGGVLPIELSSFTAKIFNTSVQLNWSTATELNNDYFTIERSVDGVVYQAIDELEGSGTTQSTQHYSYMDIDPIIGQAYYRLKQTDFDGKNETFSPVGVLFTTLKSGRLKMYPNPVRQGEIVSLQLDVDRDENLDFRLYTPSGKEIQNRKVNGDQVEINTSALVKGMYIVKVSSGNTEQTGRLMIN